MTSITSLSVNAQESVYQLEMYLNLEAEEPNPPPLLRASLRAEQRNQCEAGHALPRPTRSGS